jgi:hypothetical protein
MQTRKTPFAAGIPAEEKGLFAADIPSELLVRLSRYIGTKKTNPAIMNKRMGFDFMFKIIML